MSPIVITSKTYRKVSWGSSNPVANDILSILDYCLVNQCGWTTSVSSTSIRVFKPNTTEGYIQFRTDGNNAQGNPLGASSSYTFSVVGSKDSGLTQKFGNSPDGLVFTLNEDWTFVGNDKFFYLWFYQNDLNTTGDSNLNANYYNSGSSLTSGPNKNMTSFTAFGQFNTNRGFSSDLILYSNLGSALTNDFGSNTDLGNCYSMYYDDHVTIDGRTGLYFDGFDINDKSSQRGFCDKQVKFKKVKLLTQATLSAPRNKIAGTLPGFYGTRNSITNYATTTNYINAHNYSQNDIIGVIDKDYNNINLISIVAQDIVMFIDITSDWGN